MCHLSQTQVNRALPHVLASVLNCSLFNQSGVLPQGVPKRTLHSQALHCWDMHHPHLKVLLLMLLFATPWVMSSLLWGPSSAFLIFSLSFADWACADCAACLQREAGLRSLGLGQKAVQPWADLSKQVTQQMIAVQERRLGGNMVKQQHQNFYESTAGVNMMHDAVWHALLLQVSGMGGHIGEQSKASNKKRCSRHVPGTTCSILTPPHNTAADHQ